MDSRARRNLTNINSELQDVHKIMIQNVEDVLQRGEALSGLIYYISHIWMLTLTFIVLPLL